MENINNKVKIAKMNSLIDRMDKHQSYRSAMLNEGLIIEAMQRSRTLVDNVTEFFDKLDELGGGKKVTFGYISFAKLNYPQVKRKNPATNRMKNYDDMDTFGQSLGATEPVAGVVKMSVINLNWTTVNSINDKYSEYKNAKNLIRAEYGLDPIGHKKYTNDINFGNGIKGYGGDNEEKMSHTYSPQNTYGANTKRFFYLIAADGHIIRELQEDEIKQYFKPKGSFEGESALRKLGADDAKIQEYIKKIKDLKFNYQNFEHSSIVFLAGSFGGERQLVLNKNLVNKLGEVGINPQEFLDFAKARYEKELDRDDYL